VRRYQTKPQYVMRRLRTLLEIEPSLAERRKLIAGCRAVQRRIT